MQEFKDCVNMIEVEDLCSSGLFFTWTKNLKKAREGNHTGVLKKLDRVMVNESFMKKYDKAHVIFNPYLVSDHSQAVVVIPSCMKKKKKAFKFANFVADKDSFIPLVEKEWKKQIDGFQMYQRNIIEKIQDVNGINHGGQDVAEQFVIHFQRFLDQKGDVMEISECRSLFYNKISNEEACSMVCDVSLKEIKDALFDIGDNKALGPDGCIERLDERWAKQSLLSILPFIQKLKILSIGRKRVKTRGSYVPLSVYIGHGVFYFDDGKELKVVRETIDEFGECSSLLPNFNKSTIFFGSKKDEIQEEIMKVMPFEKGKLHMKYIGVPLITKRLGIENCKCLVDRVRDRISNWKNKCLSYAGRLQLIASILESIQLSRGKAKIAWKKNCKPKSHGGLGLKDLEIWNKALLVKHIWNLAAKKDTLWVKWWPKEWENEYPRIKQINDPALIEGKDDWIVWKNKDNKECKFSTREVYKDMRNQSSEIKWTKLVWYSQCIPKQSFILWMAIQGKLMTCDRMAKWGSYNMTVCSLCKKNEESHDHLFFKCQFPDAIWKKLRVMMKFQSNNDGWDKTIEELANMPNVSSIWSIVRRLCLASAVYSIWTERNNRLFRDEVCNWEVVLEMICEIVRLRLMDLNVKNSKAVHQVAKEWNVTMKIQ
ncbi:RNA-directed DNA polymerase, eukaryota, reverse transcriptase zinc-binding domain protein [Tanacetum coccineum]